METLRNNTENRFRNIKMIIHRIDYWASNLVIVLGGVEFLGWVCFEGHVIYIDVDVILSPEEGDVRNTKWWAWSIAAYFAHGAHIGELAIWRTLAPGGTPQGSLRSWAHRVLDGAGSEEMTSLKMESSGGIVSPKTYPDLMLMVLFLMPENGFLSSVCLWEQK